jgi:hypothetical protein
MDGACNRIADWMAATGGLWCREAAPTGQAGS